MLVICIAIIWGTKIPSNQNRPVKVSLCWLLIEYNEYIFEFSSMTNTSWEPVQMKHRTSSRWLIVPGRICSTTRCTRIFFLPETATRENHSTSCSSSATSAISPRYHFNCVQLFVHSSNCSKLPIPSYLIDLLNVFHVILFTDSIWYFKIYCCFF